MAQIDQPLQSNPPSVPIVLAKVKETRAEGEELHKAGKHGESARPWTRSGPTNELAAGAVQNASSPSSDMAKRRTCCRSTGLARQPWAPRLRASAKVGSSAAALTTSTGTSLSRGVRRM